MVSNHSLRQTLLRLILIPSVSILLILIGIILFAAFLLRQEAVNRQEITIDALSRQANQYLESSEWMLTTLAGSLQELSFTQQSALIDQARLNSPRFSSFLILNQEGLVISESSQTLGMRGLDFSSELFFREVKKTRASYFSEPFISAATGRVSIYGSVPVFQREEFIGVLTGELNMETLQEAIEESNQLEDSTTFIVDRHGTLVAHPEDTWVQEQRNFGNLDVVKKGLDNKTPFNIFYDEETHTWLVGAATPMRFQWVVISLQPLSKAGQPLIYLALGSVIAFLISLSFFIWAQLYNIRNITQPILTLVQKTNAIANGQYETVDTSTGQHFDEINSLTVSFNKMTEAIQERDRYLEQKVNERTSQLLASNRELEAFSYSVSHDLRAPLRRIDGYSHMLMEQMEGNIDSESQHFLDRILASVSLMNQLIESLLSLSRLTRGDITCVQSDLSQIADTIVDELKHSEPDRQVSVSISPNLIAFADEKMMRIMLENLLGNAWKFTSRCESPRIEFFITRARNQPLVYCVRDNGAGFDMQYADKLFSAFQRLHAADEFPGSGIGLAIVQRIINRHGGQIWAESKVGEGAAFYFTLPNTQ